MSIDPGGVVDKRYEVYCLVDQHFYDSTPRFAEHARDFELSRAPAPEGWSASERDNWHVLRPNGGEFLHRVEGACLGIPRQRRADRTTVADYCQNGGSRFKFLRSLDVLKLANAKYANRGSSGKFITIYPANEAQLEVVLVELGEALEGNALHFSNGGGLYVGQHISTGAQIVLKEARPHAGLDMDSTDAVARLRREREMLERLAGLDVVPAVHGSFTVGDHRPGYWSVVPLLLILMGSPWLVSHGATTGTVLGVISYVSMALRPALRTLIRGVGGNGLWLLVTLRRLVETVEPAVNSAVAVTERGGITHLEPWRAEQHRAGHQRSSCVVELRGVTFAYDHQVDPGTIRHRLRSTRQLIN